MVMRFYWMGVREVINRGGRGIVRRVGGLGPKPAQNRSRNTRCWEATRDSPRPGCIRDPGIARSPGKLLAPASCTSVGSGWKHSLS